MNEIEKESFRQEILKESEKEMEKEMGAQMEQVKILDLDFGKVMERKEMIE